jgi:hypothetical protein
MLRCSVNKLATKFSSRLRREAVRHSCDWSSPGAVYIGFRIDYLRIFRHTPYHHKYIYNDYQADFSGLMEAPAQTKELEEDSPRDSHIALQQNWKSFITEKHLNNKLLHQIQVRLDVYKSPMCYNPPSYDISCSIAFGYNITKQELEIRNEATESFIRQPELEFPVDMKHIIQDFVTYFHDKHFDEGLKAKDKCTYSEDEFVLTGPSLIRYLSL